MQGEEKGEGQRETGRPSLTALGAARHRAAHQVLDGGRIFADPLALRILGSDAETVAREAQEHGAGLRLFVAARARFAEDALARAVASGTRQLVVLGAGLDTYAYRQPLAERLCVFEVDDPATQSWKRSLLAAAAIPIPSTLTFAPFDFEREALADALAAAGFESVQPSFFSWLGVTPYLTEQAILTTLGYIAALPGTSEVVFDYASPPTSIPAEWRAAYDAFAARVAAAGEPLKSYFTSAALAEQLRRLGFTTVEDLGPREVAARFLGEQRQAAPGGHIVRAAR
jgi:methyltransferase (TIGR00027 family)